MMSVYKLLIKEIGTVEPGIVLIYARNESAFQSISTVNIVLVLLIYRIVVQTKRPRQDVQ